MSHYDDAYKRRLRIVCKPENPTGYSVSITDLDTGKAVPNVCAAVIYLKPDKVNEVELTYWESDEQGRIIQVEDDVVVKRLRVNEPEIDLTVYEK